MNNYVTLDGYKYMTMTDWCPVPVKPATSRYLLNASVDVSYGPGMFKEYQGTLIVPASPASGWGGRSDLEASFEKVVGLSFTDHEGNSETVHMFGRLQFESMSPRWDGASNEFHFPVRLVCE